MKKSTQRNRLIGRMPCTREEKSQRRESTKLYSSGRKWRNRRRQKRKTPLKRE